MSKRLPMPLLTLLAISMMVLAACSGGDDGAPAEDGDEAAPAEEVAEEEPIIFGFAVHLTGWMNAWKSSKISPVTATAPISMISISSRGNESSSQQVASTSTITTVFGIISRRITLV